MTEKLDDITLMDYADGLLDADDVASVEAFIECNPEAKQKVEDFRRSSEILEIAHGDDDENEVPQSSIDLIKNAEQPTAKILSFPAFKRIPRYLANQAIAAGLVGILIGYAGNHFFDPFIGKNIANAPFPEVAELSEPKPLMKGDTEKTTSATEIETKLAKLKQFLEVEPLNYDWTPIFEGAEAKIEKSHDFSLDVRAKLKLGNPYLMADGRFCRDVRFEQVTTSHENPVILTGCRQDNGTWSLVNIKSVDN